MKRLGVLGVLALAVGSIYGQTPPLDSEYVKIVTTGEIKKIDDKNKTFQFKFSLDPAPAVNRARGPQQPQGGGGPGGGRRRGGVGFPGRDRYPAPVPVE